MHLAYLYNEILPKKTAHDVYVVQQCASLAKNEVDVTLLCGRGSADDRELRNHYSIPQLNSLHIQRIPIVRNNFGFKLSWNRVFFHCAQCALKRIKPDVIITSVVKQADYHFSRKLPGTTYVYEVHGLQWYPGLDRIDHKKLALEKAMLDKADLITVTTGALAKILQAPPYCLRRPIEVIPLAGNATPLPTGPPKQKDLHLFYVGQLYPEQGIELLLQALEKTEGIHLEVVGGKTEEIAHLKNHAQTLGLQDKVIFHGFCAPGKLTTLLAHADAFVAPFHLIKQMPHVAHTKLLEYARWGRPFVVPDCPVVREHFSENYGVLLFDADNADSLSSCLARLKDSSLYHRLMQDIASYATRFTWQERSRIYRGVLETADELHRW